MHQLWQDPVVPKVVDHSRILLDEFRELVSTVYFCLLSFFLSFLVWVDGRVEVSARCIRLSIPIKSGVMVVWEDCSEGGEITHLGLPVDIA
jgi:hypothetical protein